MKYKLINLQTKEEHLCDKVIIDGFDYYVTNINPIMGSKYFDDTNIIREVTITDTAYWSVRQNYKSIISTNNPNIDITKVVGEVEMLGEDETNIRILQHKTPSQISRQYFDGFINGYNKSQETHPHSDEDMIEFYEWCDTSEEAAIFWRRNRVDPDMSGNHWKKIRENREKLLKLWKEQQPKIVYYE